MADTDRFNALFHFTASIRIPRDRRLFSNALFNSYALREKTEKRFEKRAEENEEKLRGFFHDFSSFDVVSLCEGETPIINNTEDEDRYHDYKWHLRGSPDDRPSALRIQGTFPDISDRQRTIITDATDPVNEFRLVRKGGGENSDYEVQKFFARLVACTRSSVFIPATSIRFHHLFMPPGRLEVKGESPIGSVIAVPYLTFRRGQDAVAMRRTFSLSIFFAAVNESGEPAELSEDQVSDFMRSVNASVRGRADSSLLIEPFISLSETSELGQFLGLKANLDGCLIRYIFEKLPIFPRPPKGTKDAILANNLVTSPVWAVMLLDPTNTMLPTKSEAGLKKNDLIHWIRDPESNEGVALGKVRDLLSGLYMEDRVESHAALYLECYSDKLSTNTRIVTDLVFFGSQQVNETVPTFLYITTAAAEGFPNHSCIWAFCHYTFMAISLSSSKQMVQGFHRELAKEDNYDVFIDVSREFVVDFEEFYNLDILRSFYKDDYEIVKQRSGLARDYEQLKLEVAMLRDQIDAKNREGQAETTNVLTWWVLYASAIVVALTALAICLDDRAKLGLRGIEWLGIALFGFFYIGILLYVIYRGRKAIRQLWFKFWSRVLGALRSFLGQNRPT